MTTDWPTGVRCDMTGDSVRLKACARSCAQNDLRSTCKDGASMEPPVMNSLFAV